MMMWYGWEPNKNDPEIDIPGWVLAIIIVAMIGLTGLLLHYAPLASEHQQPVTEQVDTQ